MGFCPNCDQFLSFQTLLARSQRRIVACGCCRSPLTSHLGQGYVSLKTMAYFVFLSCIFYLFLKRNYYYLLFTIYGGVLGAIALNIYLQGRKARWFLLSSEGTPLSFFKKGKRDWVPLLISLAFILTIFFLAEIIVELFQIRDLWFPQVDPWLLVLLLPLLVFFLLSWFFEIRKSLTPSPSGIPIFTLTQGSILVHDPKHPDFDQEFSNIEKVYWLSATSLELVTGHGSQLPLDLSELTPEDAVRARKRLNELAAQKNRTPST